MPDDHESVAIAQVTFYAPVIPVTAFVLVKNWPIGSRMSRIPWLTLLVLSLMRFTGGILVIVRESDVYNLALTITTVVLLNVGLIPLIMSTIGMISIVLSSSTEEHKFISRMFMIFRLLFITALSLLLVGAGTSLHGDLIGDSLVRAAYIIFTAVILIIIAMIFYLWSEKHKLGPASLIYLFGATVAIPFLILRIVYAALSAFLTPTIWSPLEGSAVAFALMALLPEYVTIAIYVYLGFHRIREKTARFEEATVNGVDQSNT